MVKSALKDVGCTTQQDTTEQREEGSEGKGRKKLSRWGVNFPLFSLSLLFHSDTYCHHGNPQQEVYCSRQCLKGHLVTSGSKGVEGETTAGVQIVFVCLIALVN